jgi:hypothetical protein
MARLKKTSNVLETARQRLAGLKAITPTANFGANLTEPIYTAKIDSAAARLDRYNQILSEADQELNAFQKEESELNDLNRRFLSAGAATYGPDSSEVRNARRHPQERT